MRKGSGRQNCAVSGCPRPHMALGYCSAHHHRFKLYGDPLVSRRRASGQGSIVYGYIRVGKKFQHRTVMEGLLGRDLLPGETVHHRNGQRADNRPENLELWVSIQPKGQRVTDLLRFARELLERYAGTPIDKIEAI